MNNRNHIIHAIENQLEYERISFSFFTIEFWELLVNIVNQNMAQLKGTKKNPIKVTNIIEIIHFYGKFILFYFYLIFIEVYI